MKLVPLSGKVSSPVTKWSEIKEEALALVQFMEEMNGKFEGEHPKAYCLAHCQVNQDNPYRFFVADKEFVKKEKFFKHQVVINPKIISTTGEQFYITEACMSYPFKKEKKMHRHMFLSVEYEIPTVLGHLRKVKVDVKWPVSQIFQHEIQHMDGSSIYYSQEEMKIYAKTVVD